MNLTKEEALDLLWENPIKIGHWVGFRDLTEIHNEWLKDFLFYPFDQTLQGHRGSYKTTTLSLFFAIHAIIFPNETVLFFRKTDRDIAEIIRQTIRILQSSCMNEITKALYNGKNIKLLKSSASEIQTNLSSTIRGTSQIVGLGIGTSITGKHADIIVTDDIVNINDRISKAEREKTKLAYQELINICNRGGRFINTGTPWHQEDAFTLMPNIRKYDCYSTKLISKEKLEDIKSKMLPSLFAANYELRHIASEDIIFDNPKTGADPSLILGGKMHVDSAFYGEDFTAWSIMTKHDGKYYVYGSMKRKHVEDCYNLIKFDYDRFKCPKIWTELNADKGFTARDMRKQGLKVATYSEGMNKFLKIVTYLKAIWKDLYFIEGTDPEFIKQITDYFEDAEHDDAPDTVASLARIFYNKGNNTEYKPLWN